MKISSLVRAAAAVAVRRTLWLTAVRQLSRMAPDGWWRRPPFLPIPPADYLGFRLQTQYGDADAQPLGADVVNYLQWVRMWDRAGR